MSAPTCTLSGLASPSACFRQQVFTAKEQRSIIAWLWWQWANSVDTGSDPATIDQLLASSTCLNGYNEDQFMAAQIAILNRGTDSFGTLSAESEIVVLTPATAAEAIKCFDHLTDAQVQATVVLNMCRFFRSFSS